MVINNLDLITPLLTFESEDDYYLLQIIKRRKDNPEMDKNEQVLRTIYITSLEKLYKLWGDIEDLSFNNNARIYINLNVKSMKATALLTMRIIACRAMTDNYKGAYHIFDSAAGRCGATRDKKWIVDLDEKDAEFDFGNYVGILTKCIDKCLPEGNKVLKTIQTLNGVHLITNPFNINEFREKLEERRLHCPDIHKNNPTLLYFDNNKQQ